MIDIYCWFIVFKAKLVAKVRISLAKLVAKVRISLAKLEVIIVLVNVFLSARLRYIQLYISQRQIYTTYRDFTEPIFVSDKSVLHSDFESDQYAKITVEIIRMREFGVRKKYLISNLSQIASQNDSLEMRAKKVIQMSYRIRGVQ